MEVEDTVMKISEQLQWKLNLIQIVSEERKKAVSLRQWQNWTQAEEDEEENSRKPPINWVQNKYAMNKYGVQTVDAQGRILHTLYSRNSFYLFSTRNVISLKYK